MNGVSEKDRKITRFLLWAFSITYGLLFYLILAFCFALFQTQVTQGTPLSLLPIISLLAVLLLPYACVAGVIAGWLYYGKGAFRKAKLAIFFPVAYVIGILLLAWIERLA